MSGPPSPAWSRSSEGISSRQGTHHVAQMLSSTNRPSNAFSVISSPSPSTNVSSGNGLGVSSTDRENSLPEGVVVTGVHGEDNPEISFGDLVQISMQTPPALKADATTAVITKHRFLMIMHNSQ